MNVCEKFVPSKYTEGFEQYAHPAISTAMQIERIKWPIQSTTVGTFPVTGADVIVEYPLGLQMAARATPWAMIISEALAHAPDVVFPPNQDFDADLTNMLETIARGFSTATQIVMAGSIARVAALAMSKVPSSDSVPRSKIWARGQGNTLASVIKDYQFRRRPRLRPRPKKGKLAPKMA